MKLYYVRHGETAWSQNGRHTGLTDIPLTPHGEDQSRALRPWLNHVAFTRVLVSPRKRARHTCELAGLGATAQTEPDLAEWDYGDYEGERSIDIRARVPGWSLFRDGCPAGESAAEVGGRADRLIAKLAHLDGNIALFSHGEFGSVLAARWIGLQTLEAQHFSLDPASLNVLGHRSGHPAMRAISLWNASPSLLAAAA